MRPCRLLAAALLVSLPARVVSQGRPDGQLPAPIATLALWADDVWFALLDRDGSYFGRLAEQGTFQRFNPLMDKEYELDLWTGLFSLGDDARWAETRAGLRAAGASINHPFILNVVDWRQGFGITRRVDLLARYLRQRTLTTQRDYATLGVAWGDAFGSPWELRAGIGMHFFKASADVELGVTRRWPGGDGQWVLEAHLALLDAFNNLIFNTLGVQPDETEAHFSYERLPLAGRVAVAGSWPAARIEVRGGASTRSEVLVTFPLTAEPSFVLAERVAFAGVLGELRPSRRIALAAYGTWARAESARRLTAAGGEERHLEEETTMVGARGRVAATRDVALELDGRATWRPEDRRLGDGSTLRHRDREFFGQAALVRRPETGWLWRLGYAVLDRDAGILVPDLTATNHRQLMEGGYRFRSGFEIVGGLRWDLDRLQNSPFDGGHLRLAVTW